MKPNFRLSALSGAAQADISCGHSYGIRTTINGHTGEEYCSNKSQTFIDYVKHLKNTHPDYTSASAADIVGRFNDVDMTFSYAAGSTVLHFSAPEIGIEDKTFAGATRK